MADKKQKLIQYLIIMILSLSVNKNSSCQSVRFGVVADVQFCDCENAPRYNRYFAETSQRLVEAKDTFNQHNLSFVVNLGDMIDKDWQSFDMILPVFDAIQTEKYHVLGNHDFSVENKYKHKVPERLGMPARYYHFVKEDWRFIILDANDLSVKAHPPGTQAFHTSDSVLQALQKSELMHAKEWNGGIGKKQMKWLHQQLKSAEEDQQQVIVFSHMPVTPLNMNTLWNYKELMSVLETSNVVKAYFCGHYHEGNYEHNNGIHYLNFKGMLDTPDQNAFSIVELKDNKMIITGFGREKSVVLDF
ncbi:MAG: metallophosphoesterase [Bacteroidales bacterium]